MSKSTKIDFTIYLLLLLLSLLTEKFHHQLREH